MKVDIDYLEKEYGIKKDEKDYSIVFKSELYQFNSTIQVKGEILNFCPSQIVLKSNKGLYIIHPRNIIEMQPIGKRME